MNTHVFIVDENTFKLHLEYMFAGTGATNSETKEPRKVPFLSDPATKIHPTTEKNLVGMIADISRVRAGDNIIFYLQATNKKPGKFFGIFKAIDRSFFDDNDEDNFLMNDLNKGLSFRVKIEPKEVYQQGITEHEFLDDIESIEHPYQLCWSLIYRKLKGNRGCTMITPYEYNCLRELLKTKNKGIEIGAENYSFDNNKQIIISSDSEREYVGREESLNIKDRLLTKAKRGQAFETHLQAYILQNFDKDELKGYLYNVEDNAPWIGNEVSCGVGMQRMDIMLIEECEEDNLIKIKIVELKDEKPYDDIIDKQLPWYIKWTSQYVAANYRNMGKDVDICSCIIARKTTNKEILKRMKDENIEYVAFNFDKNYEEILFEKVI